MFVCKYLKPINVETADLIETTSIVNVVLCKLYRRLASVLQLPIRHFRFPEYIGVGFLLNSVMV
jgi:hypothetical protein